MTKAVKTRFAPSPTGHIHIGNVRTALINALYAKKNDGVFLLRVENTDQTRSKPEYVKMLKEDMAWLGLAWQEGPDCDKGAGPYFQAERGDIYDKYYTALEEAAKVYPCFCSDSELAVSRRVQQASGIAPRYAGTCRDLSKEAISQKLSAGLAPTLRFRVPQTETVSFLDLVKGEQRFACADIGDFIIRRADKTAAFFFSNAIDDALMQVTHVFRGDDHLTNTPRQMLILKALGLMPPHYGHLSTILGEDGAPLSKRHGSFSVQEVKTHGYLPSALQNYLGRLGHTYADNTFMDFNALGQHFNEQALNRAPAKFDMAQLKFWQKEAVMQLEAEAFKQWIMPELPAGKDTPDAFFALMQANIMFPLEARIWAETIFQDEIPYSDDTLEVLSQVDAAYYAEAIAALKAHGLDLKALLNAIKTKLNIKGKALYLPLRLVTTNLPHGPEMANVLQLMGLSRVQHRFASIQKRLSSLSAG